MKTRRLHIINATIPHLRCLVASPERFTDYYDISLEPGFEGMHETLNYSLWMLEHRAVDPAWWAYLFVLREKRSLIGWGGFNGSPDAQGIVEVGYNIAPAFRCKGYATEATRALVDLAFSFSRVQGVRARTMSTPNASNRVLEKCGFCFDQELLDEQDGVIWHWIKRRPVGY